VERLVLELKNGAAVRAAYREHWQHGRAFVPGAGAANIELLAEVVLVLRRLDSDAELEIPATVVLFQDDPQGVALELTDDERLDAFVHAHLHAPNVHERVRTLNLAEQQKLARTGELQERVALERQYGKNVWETLLANPRITVPEIARIARKGTVPRPLLELIIDNATWVKNTPVRRALLGNPRCGDAAIKILRLAPRPELKLIERGTAYPAIIREAARKLLGRT
jgi:Tfp pilus assembly protein PilZ